MIVTPAGRPVLAGPAPVAEAACAMDSGQLLVQERLSIDVTGDDHAVSVRMTPGETSVREEFPLPDLALRRSYDLAMRDALRLATKAPNDAGQQAADPVRLLAVALARAVPKLVRQRIATAGNLAAIELTMVADSLEEYPWELIGSPGLLGAAVDTTVWRTVVSPPPLTPKQWGNGVLLTGSEAMRTGLTYVPHELSMIASALAGKNTVTVHSEPYLVISALRGLLDRYRPTVFHLAAHGTREDLHVQNATGPTLDELCISPEMLGAELANSQVQVALLACCDSASPPLAGGRPAAYRIAAQAGAAVVGMAGKIQSHAAAVFGQAFHTALASGDSAVEAYFQGVRAIRGHPKCGVMWSLPVMYSRTSNVIPFPATDEARARLSFQQAERHLVLLDEELAALAGMGDCKPSEWAVRTAKPAVRIDGIVSYLPELATSWPSVGADRAEQHHKLGQTCSELEVCLRASKGTLSRLSNSEGQENQPNPARAELRLRRLELERVRMNLQMFFDTP